MKPKIKNYITILVIFIIIGGLFFIGKSGFSILSGLRAYVGGEGLWAKGQKDATYQLIQYVFTGDENRYQSFVENLKVPLGDKAARLELEKSGPDDEIIIQGFREGGNHPDDIPTMIFLYKYFKNVHYVKKAIEQWETGDRLIEELIEFGEQIHRNIANNRMSEGQTAQTLASIEALRKKLNEAENLFSYNMSAAARWTAKLLFVIMLLFALFGGILCFIMLRLITGIISDLNHKKTQLENQAKQERSIKKELQESEEKYRNIFENAVEGFFQSSPQGRFISVNPAFAEMLGYASPEELISNISDIAKQYYVNPEDRRQYQQLLQKTGIVENFEFKAKRKDSSQIWVSNSTRAYFDKDGKVDRYEGIVIDITERIQAEEHRRKLEDQLRQSQKLESIGTLAGGIAHDFNNILTSIIGYTELALTDAQRGSLIEENLQEVRKGGNRAADLVKQILTFARQGEKELISIRVSLIAKEALKLIRSSIPTSIKIEQHIVSDSSIMGDATRIHQIFMNLCTNAAQAMEEDGGVLKVSLTDVILDADFIGTQNALKPGNYLELIVSDTGIGISADIIQSIFEPYYTTKEPGQGTGMGLAMVHGIVQSHGGEITVESQVGKGTSFKIYLPVTKRDTEAIEYIAEDLPTGSEQILFVDDELTIVKMGRQMLERLGYTVTNRTSSIEALALFRNKPDHFDMVITDMAMPHMTGDKFAVELMKIRPDIPVILCTGYSKKISGEQASEIGIKTYVMKPLVRRDLAIAVRKVLDQKIDH